MGKGQTRAHGVAKCSKCPAQSNLCPKKKEARQAAKGWRSPPPPPPRHKEGATARSLPASPPSEIATAAEEMEVEELTLPPGVDNRMEE